MMTLRRTSRPSEPPDHIGRWDVFLAGREKWELDRGRLGCNVAVRGWLLWFRSGNSATVLKDMGAVAGNAIRATYFALYGPLRRQA
jgi:hypothetical protein